MLPLAAVNTLVGAVAEGDLRKKVDVTSKDEVGEMMTAINQMVDNLRKTVASVAAGLTWYTVRAPGKRRESSISSGVRLILR